MQTRFLHPSQRIRGCPSRPAAFTLIELLTAITIIMLLASLLLPALVTARKEAKAVPCANNLRQMGLAATMYTQDYDRKLPYMGYRANRLIWNDLILPYITGEPVDNCYGGSLQHPDYIPTFRCPSSTNPKKGGWGAWASSYAMLGQRLRPHLTYRPAALETPAGLPTWMSTATQGGLVRDAGTVGMWWNRGGWDCSIPTSTYVDNFHPGIEFRPLIHVPAPSATACLTECDHFINLQGWRGGVERVDYQTAPTGAGYQWNSLANNITLELHLGYVNYLYVDGHVGFHDPFSTEVIGPAGTVAVPRGIWTVDPND